MSAIGGVFSSTKSDKPIQDFVYHILSKLEHRGSKDEGFVFFDEEGFTANASDLTQSKFVQKLNLKDQNEVSESALLGLGHKQGTIENNFQHQPLQISNGNYSIVLDGEILNAKQIAKTLRDQGVNIETEDQTEILLTAYQFWKEKILSKLDGSFAFVIYDRVENKLFGARDPFGIRPFYYFHNDRYFAFGSELKSLINLPFVSKKVSKSAVYDYLILGQSETSSQTMFRGLSELLPGSAFSIMLPRGSMKIWSFFTLTTDSKLDRYSRNKVSTLAHRLRKSMISNINHHLSPEFKTVYNFNTSLESLAFPYLLKESIAELKSNDRPKLSEIFSGIFNDVNLEEEEENNHVFENSQKIAKELEVELIRSVCKFEDFQENIKKVCYLQDVPFTSLEVFAQFKMLEVAKANQVQIVIENTGGNQLFSNNNYHFHQYTEDLLASGQYRLFMENFMNSSASQSSKWNLLKHLSKRWIFRSTNNDLKETLIKTNQEEFEYIKVDFVDRYSKNLESNINNIPTSLNQMLLRELSGPLVKEKLRTTDRNSQFHQVEVRNPYVSDRELAESMLKASSVYKIRAGVSGNLLRKALRGVFPDHILNGKQGIPDRRDNHWLLYAKEELKEYITSDLDDFIDSKKVKRDWDQLVLMANKESNDFLWRIVNLGIWQNAYFH